MARDHNNLWNRVDVAYHRRRPPFRALKRWLSFAFSFGAIGWVAALAMRNNETPFDSGPPSDAHRMIAGDCFRCHVEPWRGVQRLMGDARSQTAMNQACLTCHGGSIAFDPQRWVARHVSYDPRSGDPPYDAVNAAPVPQDSDVACGACHREHEGSSGLLEIADNQCIRCHADLGATHPSTEFARQISSFVGDHPEFGIIEIRVADATKLKLNHAVHLKPNLLGPGRIPVQMTCSDCHRPTGVNADWPYALSSPKAGSSVATQSLGNGATMQPIRYALHCAACHKLTVDPESNILPGGEIPHESPERIRVYLRGQLSAHADEHPEVLSEDEDSSAMRGPTLREAGPERERLKSAWVNERIGMIEQLLYKDRRDCLYCHEQEWPNGAGGLPIIVPPSMPNRWFAHAQFDHERHKIVACNACHTKATSSTATGDVLLPGITLCRTCHAPASGSIGGADHRCITCHTYHKRPVPGASGLNLEALQSGARKSGNP